MLTLPEHGIFTASKYKNAKIVGIFIFISRESSCSAMLSKKKSYYSKWFDIYSQDKFYAQLSWSSKTIYNLGGQSSFYETVNRSFK